MRARTQAEDPEPYDTDESVESLLSDPAVQNSFAVAPITSTLVLVAGKAGRAVAALGRRMFSGRKVEEGE